MSTAERIPITLSQGKPAYQDPSMHLPWPDYEVGTEGPVDIDYIRRACRRFAEVADLPMREALLRHRAATVRMVEALPSPSKMNGMQRAMRRRLPALHAHLAMVDELLDAYP